MRGPESRQPGDINFHYNREDRESRLPEGIINRRQNGFFSRNRHLLLIFVDILIMTAIGMFLLPYLRGGDQEASGYRFSMNISLFDGTILTAVRAEPASGAAEENAECTIRILPQGRESRQYVYLIPTDEKQIIRGRMPYVEGDRQVEAVIRISGEEITLKRKIPGE